MLSSTCCSIKELTALVAVALLADAFGGVSIKITLASAFLVYLLYSLAYSEEWQEEE